MKSELGAKAFKPEIGSELKIRDFNWLTFLAYERRVGLPIRKHKERGSVHLVDDLSLLFV
jgi:hypothetical protein